MLSKETPELERFLASSAQRTGVTWATVNFSTRSAVFLSALLHQLRT